MFLLYNVAHMFIAVILCIKNPICWNIFFYDPWCWARTTDLCHKTDLTYPVALFQPRPIKRVTMGLFFPVFSITTKYGLIYRSEKSHRVLQIKILMWASKKILLHRKHQLVTSRNYFDCSFKNRTFQSQHSSQLSWNRLNRRTSNPQLKTTESVFHTFIFFRNLIEIFSGTKITRIRKNTTTEFK